jgi:hypothetical protein
VVTLESAEAAPALLAEVVADGRVLVDRDGRWSNLKERAPSLRRSAWQRDSRRRKAALAGIDRMLTG